MRPHRSCLALSAALLLACGAQDTPSEPEAPLGPLDFAGRYEVTGVTVDQATGSQRPIYGTVVLKQAEGERYTSHFELATVYPGSDSVAAQVVGTGEGAVAGWRLEGTSETTLVVSSAPGVDTRFAYIPRMVSARIASTSTATFHQDGTVSIEIENLPAEDEEDYSPTRTTLVGYRLEDG